jgi:hypothetical protein
MRNLLILLATTPLLMAQGANTGLPRPYCGYGEGLAALREVAREAALPVPGIMEGRARGEVVVRALSSAAATFTGCGCARLAELTREAERVAQGAPSEASIARLSQLFSQVGFRTQLVREQAERAGCR